jgi:predicted MFS family arabinose efflux permease
MRRVRRERATPVVTFGSVVRHREFAVVWLADAQSSIGDQLARVALAVLVFFRTGSGLETAATYALSYLPALIGGAALSGLADRFRRRELLVAFDVLRAVLMAAMAIPGLPLAVVWTLLVLAVAVGSPYRAAESALIADFFDHDAYVTATGLRSATSQFAQLLGFGVGGVMVAAIGARGTLLVDAATFLLSALGLGLVLRPRPKPAGGQRTTWAQLRHGIDVVAHSARLRTLLGLSALAGCWIVPEGLAVPYAHAHGGGAAAAGVLLAANPAGSMLGALLLSRWASPAFRRRTIGALAGAAGLPLVVCAVHPGLVVAGLLWGLCGILSAYLVVVFPEFVTATPEDVRGQAIGLAASVLLAAQGVGLLAGGALASATSPAAAIAVAGLVGSAAALPLAWAWGRQQAVSERGAPSSQAAPARSPSTSPSRIS